MKVLVSFISSNVLIVTYIKQQQQSIWQSLVKCQVSEGASGMSLVTESVWNCESMCTVQWVVYADQVHARKVGNNYILVFPSRC